MSRLIHHPSGFRRAHSISSTELFIYVEGIDNDRYFISTILSKLLSNKILKYEIRIANEIPHSTGGGKNVIIKFHNELKIEKQLKHKNFGRNTCYLFILDKDIDDLLGKKLRSKHIIYSKYYTIENHLYVSSDLPRAIASAASLPVQDVKAIIPNQKRWLRRVKNYWREWLTICHFATKHRIHEYKTYRRATSPINHPACSQTCNAKFQNELSIIKTKSGLDQHTFDQSIAASEQIIAKRLRRGGECIFKGKWYPSFVHAELKCFYASRPFNCNHFETKLSAAIAALWGKRDSHFERKLSIFITKVLP